MKEIKYIEIPADSSTQQIYNELDRICTAGDFPYGNVSILRIHSDRTFECVSDAKRYLDHQSYPGISVAVKCKVRPEYQESDRLKALKEKGSRALEAWNQADSKLYYTPENVKRSFVSCRNGCGSRLSVGHLDSNFCPVCSEDLRPDSVLTHNRKLLQEYTELKKKVMALETAEVESWDTKAEVKLLVRIEVYSLPETKYRWLRTVSDDGAPYLYLDGCFRYRDMETDHIEIHCNEDADNTYDVYLNLWHVTMSCDALEDGDGNRIESNELYCDISDENIAIEEAEKNLVSLDRAPKISSVTAWG